MIKYLIVVIILFGSLTISESEKKMAFPIEFIIGLKVLFIDLLIKAVIPLSIGLGLLVVWTIVWTFKTWLQNKK